MLNRTHLHLFCAAALLLILAAPVGTQTASRDRILRAIDPAATSPVRGTAHPLARGQFDQGRADSNRLISGASLVFRLSPAQQAGLDRLLQQQQDPSSANYHEWLTPEEYANRFGMTQNDLAKVTTWLQSQGLRVDSISRSRTEVFFSGAVAQIEHALQTEIHNYSINGEQHFANRTDISLPAAFSADVAAVRGLNDFHPRSRIRKTQSHFTSSVSGNHFVEPGDFATIYHLGPLYSQGLDGTGQKIAVVGQTAISLTDIRAFRSASGLSQNDPTIQLVPNTGTSTTCSGDVTEADLDVEWSGGVAKNANVIYVYAGVGTGGTCTNRTKDVFDALQFAISNNVAPVISISYGNCEASIGSSTAATFRQWMQQANAQGQTITAASGDDGAADCDFNDSSAIHGLAVDIPAAIPEVTGIGGTEFTGDSQVTVTNGCAPADTYWSGSCSPTSGASALSYIPETVWNDPPTTSFSAGGGGASTFFTKAQAPWQAGPGVPNDSKRDVPDVSLNASPVHDPYLLCTGGSCVNGFRNATNSLAAVGGTSAGAPAFAGILAIINQATQSMGQGNANSKLYSLAVSTPSAFHDTTTGNNNVPCTKGSTGCPTSGNIGFSATANYDQASGLGSLDVFNLVTAWPGFVSTPGFSLGVNPAALTIAAAGQSGSSTVTVGQVNGFSGTVNLSCAVPSTATSKISCSISPSSVVINSTNTSQSATLGINALAASAALQHRRLELLALFTVVPGILLLGVPRRRGRMLLGFLAAGLLAFTLGCGGGSSSSSVNQNQNTSATYAVTVNASSGSVTHSLTVNVTVK
jgi:subtilase family serine protease